MLTRILPALCATLMLTSCATNAIRLDRAETMSEAGRKASDATLAFADRAIAANRDALIDIVAFDPSCDIPEPLVKFGKQEKTEKLGQAKKVNRLPGEATLCGGSDTKSFPFARQTRRDLAVTAAVVDSIAAYLDAVDAVLEQDDIDIVGSFENAQGDLQAIKTIFGSDTPLLTDGQSSAISSALTLLQEIASESAKVDGLRAIEAQILRDNQPIAYDGSSCSKLDLKDPPAQISTFDDSVCGLQLANAQWETVFRSAQGSRFSLANYTYSENPPAEFDKRRAAVKAQVELYELKEAGPQLRAALDNLADKFANAHKAYFELLPGGSKAELTPKEKAKRARIERERVRAALRTVAELVKAF